MVSHISTDTPDAPKALEIEKYDKSSCSLKWNKPDSDGGNPIKGKNGRVCACVCPKPCVCGTGLYTVVVQWYREIGV